MLRELPARVVDEHVDAAHLGVERVEERVDGLGLADVGRPREAGVPERREQRARLVERLGAPPADGDARAELGGRERDRLADARAAARDEEAHAVEQPCAEGRGACEHVFAPQRHSRSTPYDGAPIGAESDACSAMPSASRVSTGSRMPSSHRCEVE